MRLLPALLCCLPLLALQARAQTTPSPPTTTATAAATAGTAASTTAVMAPPAQATRPKRMSWQQRFAQANTTHDGHLTLQQAEQGYRTVARHFQQIDVDKKGYVTVQDIDAWHKLQRAMRHPNQGQTDHSLRPRPAMQRGTPEPREINTSTDTKVMPMTQPDPPAPASDTTSPASTRHGT